MNLKVSVRCKKLRGKIFKFTVHRRLLCKHQRTLLLVYEFIVQLVRKVTKIALYFTFSVQYVC